MEASMRAMAAGVHGEAMSSAIGTSSMMNLGLFYDELRMMFKMMC